MPTNFYKGGRQIMMLSVIIPTRNRSDLLSMALLSLTRQTLAESQFEILIIDNGSTDNTAQITERYSTQLHNLKYFYEPEPGLHAGRHRGMLEAQNDILVFADDDIEALPTWLESIQSAFCAPDVAMVGGNNLPMFVSPPPEWLLALWNRSYKRNIRAIPALSIIEINGAIRDYDPYYVWGCNFSIRKKVLYAAGGFHPDGMPKELIKFRGDGETHVSRFVKECGMRCIFHPGASVHHKVTQERMTFDYFYQRGFNQGISDSYSIMRNQNNPPKFQIKQSLLSKLFNYGAKQLAKLTPLERDAKQALFEMKCGYHEGYSFHQKMYLENEDVRIWTHKPKYFGEDDV